MSGLFLGVDSGQTSTTALVAGEDGRIVARASGEPCNHVGAERGAERFSAVMTGCLDTLCARAGLDGKTVTFESAALGFSGGAADKRALLESLVRTRRMWTGSDMDVALMGALAGEPGVVVIGGTGSAAFGRDAAGRTARAGGWGFRFGDEGSAFDIVRQAMRAALRQVEGWGPPTALHGELLAATGIGNVHDLVRECNTASYTVAAIAGYARLVDRTAERGDAVALAILQDAAAHLANLLAVVRRGLFGTAECVPSSFIGGVFHSGIVNERYRALAAEAGCTVAAPVYPGAGGALLQAFRLCGMRPAIQGIDGEWE